MSDPNQISGPNSRRHITYFTYDDLGRQTEIWEGLRSVTNNVTTTVWEKFSRQRFDANGNLIGSDREIAYTYGTMDGLGVYTTYSYDAFNRLIDMTEGVSQPEKRRTTMSYDLNGNLIGVTKGIVPGQEDEFIPDFDDLEQEVQLYQHRLTTTYAYDAYNRRISQSDGVGGEHGFYHQPLDFVSRIAGSSVSTVPSISSGLPVTTTVYDDNNNVIATIDPRGVKPTYKYDALNRRIVSIQADATPALLRLDDKPTTTLTYDVAGNVIRIEAPEGAVTERQFDKLNRLTTLTEAVGTPQQRITTFVYDTQNNLISKTEGQSTITTYAHVVVTTYAYDGQNRLLEQTQAAYGDLGMAPNNTPYTGLTTRYKYRADGQLIEKSVLMRYGTAQSSSSASVSETVYEYDNLNHLTLIKETAAASVIDGQPANTYRLTTMINDVAGNVRTLVKPTGVTVTYDYDRLGRRTRIQGDIGGDFNTTISYDATDNFIKRETPAEVNWYYYDSQNRLVSEWRGTRTKAGESITYDRPVRHSYDIAGNKTEDYQRQTIGFVRNPNGRPSDSQFVNRTIYAYDALNRRISTTFNSKVVGLNDTWQTSTNAYYANGLLERSIAEDGTVRRFWYDKLGRLKEELWFQNSAAAAQIPQYQVWLYYTYDAANNTVSSFKQERRKLISSAASTTTFTFETTRTFDSLNRTKTDTNPFGITVTSRYSYENFKSKINTVEAYANGALTESDSTYDGVGHMVKKEANGRLVITFDWQTSSIAGTSHKKVFDLATQYTFSLATPQAGTRQMTVDRKYVGGFLTTIQYNFASFGLLGKTADTYGYELDPDTGLIKSDHRYIEDTIVRLTNAQNNQGADRWVPTSTEFTTPYVKPRASLPVWNGQVVPQGSSMDTNGNAVVDSTQLGSNNRLIANNQYTYGYDPTGTLGSRTRLQGTQRTSQYYFYDQAII